MQEVPHFLNYCWKEGKPCGLKSTSGKAKESFKVISDPYKKRYSVERYALGKFIEVVYDSNLFDFRFLKQGVDAAWQREVIKETPAILRSLIRNMDERVILLEETHFDKNQCRKCLFFSPHGVLIAMQKILSRSLGDPFDGVVLSDKLQRPILIKHYEKDAKTGEFTTLLKEEWDAPVF